MQTLNKIKELLSHVTIELFGIKFSLLVELDKKFGDNLDKRVFIQIVYSAPYSKMKEIKQWKGRKWYLSDYMTDSEIIFTALSAFKMAVEHEVLEGFKFNGIIVVNPHIDFRKLLEVSSNEVVRT